MINKIEIIVLTKSAKHHNYCVAGFDIHSKQLVRLCSSDESTAGALSYNNLICSNGKAIEIGDLIEVEIVGRGNSKIQPENLIINEAAKFKKIGNKTKQQLNEYIQNDDFIFLDTSYKLNEQGANDCKKSLLFTRVNSLVLTKQTDKVKGFFYYNKRQYKFFSVTDQEFFNVENDTKFANALVCFSLPDDSWARRNDSYYKYMAKIIPID